jgi:hypothetical protein
MKSKLRLRISTGVLIFITSLGAASAQNPLSSPPSVASKAPDAAIMQRRLSAGNPAAGSPGGGSRAVPAIDPTTGLPVAAPQPERQWIDSAWVDPETTLTNVFYDGLPMSEIARDLRDRFKNAFDILISPPWTDPTRKLIDPEACRIRLQLRNVTAGEVFRAMNLLLEAQNTPLRWQLTVNGSRPLALLRVIPELLTPANSLDPSAGELKKPMVFFVGDLIGDEKSGRMTMNQLSRILIEIIQMAYPGGDLGLGFHKDAQLVIVRGTDQQLEFVQNAIVALEQKARSTADRKMAEQNKKTEEPKPGAFGGSK